jgi:hypothetical protein
MFSLLSVYATSAKSVRPFSDRHPTSLGQRPYLFSTRPFVVASKTALGRIVSDARIFRHSAYNSFNGQDAYKGMPAVRPMAILQ